MELSIYKIFTDYQGPKELLPEAKFRFDTLVIESSNYPETHIFATEIRQHITFPMVMQGAVDFRLLPDRAFDVPTMLDFIFKNYKNIKLTLCYGDESNMSKYPELLQDYVQEDTCWT